MKYETSVPTITDILNALNCFENKDEIIKEIKQSLYDIETDYHMEEFYRNRVADLQIELQAYKDKEDKLKEFIEEQIKHIDNCLKDDAYNIDGLKGGKGALEMILEKLESRK